MDHFSDNLEIKAAESVETKNESREEREAREEREGKEFWEGVRQRKEDDFKRAELAKQYESERQVEKSDKTMSRIITIIVLLLVFGMIGGMGFLAYKKLNK